MKILAFIIGAVAAIAIVILITLILSIISSIDDCLRSYRKKINAETLCIQCENITKTVEHTKLIRDMIREDIMTEIDIYIQSKELAKEKIVMLNIDKDIEIIADNIHKGYLQLISDSNNFCCTSDHIRREIINYTTILLSSRAVAYNNSLVTKE